MADASKKTKKRKASMQRDQLEVNPADDAQQLQMDQQQLSVISQPPPRKNSSAEKFKEFRPHVIKNNAPNNSSQTTTHMESHNEQQFPIFHWQAYKKKQKTKKRKLGSPESPNSANGNGAPAMGVFDSVQADDSKKGSNSPLQQIVPKLHQNLQSRISPHHNQQTPPVLSQQSQQQVFQLNPNPSPPPQQQSTPIMQQLQGAQQVMSDQQPSMLDHMAKQQQQQMQGGAMRPSAVLVQQGADGQGAFSGQQGPQRLIYKLDPSPTPNAKENINNQAANSAGNAPLDYSNLMASSAHQHFQVQSECLECLLKARENEKLLNDVASLKHALELQRVDSANWQSKYNQTLLNFEQLKSTLSTFMNQQQQQGVKPQSQ